MKKILYTPIFCLFAIFYFYESTAQNCLPGGITLSTQADVDNFATNNPGCTVIEGNLVISGNGITGLNGLSGLTSVEGALTIENTVGLLTLDGLDNLSMVGGMLTINNNTTLSSLSALNSLTHVGDHHNFGFSIRNNPVLLSLGGLGNATPNLLGSLSIKDNSLLCHCNVQSVCSYLDSGEFAAISGNASGCSNVADVQSECDNPDNCVTAVDDSWMGQKIELYPNPTTGLIYVHGNDRDVKEIRLWYGVGNLIKSQILNGANQIDLSGFTAGVYLVELQIGDHIIIRRVVKG